MEARERLERLTEAAHFAWVTSPDYKEKRAFSRVVQDTLRELVADDPSKTELCRRVLEITEVEL